MRHRPGHLLLRRLQLQLREGLRIRQQARGWVLYGEIREEICTAQRTQIFANRRLLFSLPLFCRGGPLAEPAQRGLRPRLLLLPRLPQPFQHCLLHQDIGMDNKGQNCAA